VKDDQTATPHTLPAVLWPGSAEILLLITHTND